MGILLLLSTAAHAQLRVEPLAEAPKLDRTGMGEAPPPLLALFSDVRLSSATAPTFDFSVAKPHLAFFCRLEINEAAGGVIPVKFRLGEVRGWQQDIGRRD